MVAEMPEERKLLLTTVPRKGTVRDTEGMHTLYASQAAQAFMLSNGTAIHSCPIKMHL